VIEVDDFGPLRVVTNRLSGESYGSAPGPDRFPVVCTFGSSLTLSQQLATLACSCERAWSEVGGPPERLAHWLEVATALEAALMDRVRETDESEEGSYTHANNPRREIEVG
jgi:hypothetical protein